MKMKTILACALFGMAASIGSAFTIDAAGYDGGILTQTPVSIFVPGYGEVVFQAGQNSTLVVDSAYAFDNGFGGPSLNFDQNESVKITFNGLEPVDGQFAFVGLSEGEAFHIERDLFTPQAFVVTLQGQGDGAGIYAIGWNAVPEPSSAALGLLGSLLLVFHRRR